MQPVANHSRPARISARWEAEMRLLFWGTALFVLFGLAYVVVIGAIHR